MPAVSPPAQAFAIPPSTPEASPFDFGDAPAVESEESPDADADDYSMMPTADDFARHVTDTDHEAPVGMASITPSTAPPIPAPEPEAAGASLADLERLDSGFVEPGHEAARPYIDAQAYSAEDFGADQYFEEERRTDSTAATPVVNAAITPRLSTSIPSPAAARGADASDEFREAPDTEWPPRREVLAAGLEAIAQRIRSGELVVPGFETGMEDPAVLTAVLAAVLGVRR